MKSKLTFLAAILLLLAFTIAANTQERGEIERTGKGYIEEIHKTLNVDKGGTLYVTTPMGPIEVDSWAEEKVDVRVRKRYRGSSESKAESAFEDVEVYITKNGKDVKIRVEADRRNYRDNKVNLSFEITVPEEYNLDLETKGGSIDIGDLEGNVQAETAGGSIGVGEIRNGDVDVETKGGSISIDGIENGNGLATTAGGSISVGDVTGTLKVRTAGGSISLEKIGGKTYAKTSGGSIAIEGSGGDLIATTAGGSIAVGEVNGEVEVSTAGGSISIGPASGNVRAKTSGGSIKIKESGGSVVAGTSGGSIRVDGSGGPVEVKTSGGSIRVDDAHGSIEAKTGGGDIEAEMVVSDKDVDTHCTLKSSGGDITLWIPGDLAATFDVELEITRSADEDYEILSDFPLKIKRNRRSMTCTGDLNGGGPPIRLYTVNGYIEIKKLR